MSYFDYNDKINPRGLSLTQRLAQRGDHFPISWTTHLGRKSRLGHRIITASTAVVNSRRKKEG